MYDQSMSTYIISYTFISGFAQGSELSPLEISGIVPYAFSKDLLQTWRKHSMGHDTDHGLFLCVHATRAC
jgi:hypothetical protein